MGGGRESLEVMNHRWFLGGVRVDGIHHPFASPHCQTLTRAGNVAINMSDVLFPAKKKKKKKKKKGERELFL